MRSADRAARRIYHCYGVTGLRRAAIYNVARENPGMTGGDAAGAFPVYAYRGRQIPV